MSILLSLYTKDGIIYAADRNLTMSEKGEEVILESEMTKVLLWPKRKAVIGFVGQAEIPSEELLMDEWLRIFIGETRGFRSLKDVANLLCMRIQNAFVQSQYLLENQPRLIMHLGGFEEVEGFQTPMLYLITNVPGMSGSNYHPARPTFNVTEEVRSKFERRHMLDRYPDKIQSSFMEMEEHQNVMWFNNGTRLDAFNHFKGALLKALDVIRDEYRPHPSSSRTLFDWEVYAKMAVELHSSYFKHRYGRNKRYVGGGVDMCSIPWPVLANP
jgi:hypothetical protein